MNGSEGLRRIAAVVRWIGMGLAALSVGMGVWAATENGVSGLAGGAGFAAFFYLGARATAWIIEGFAAPK